MKTKEILLFVGVLAGISFSAAALGGLLVRQVLPEQPSVLGSAIENRMIEIPTATSVTVGSDISTLVVATNTARQYLEITNNSTVATQGLYCNTNDRAATKNSGLTIYASTSKSFNLDNLYTGALRCIFAAATSSVTVIEK